MLRISVMKTFDKENNIHISCKPQPQFFTGYQSPGHAQPQRLVSKVRVRSLLELRTPQQQVFDNT